VAKLRTCEEIKKMVADANQSMKIYVISEGKKPKKYLIKDFDLVFRIGEMISLAVIRQMENSIWLI
jgi:hypothetical protein